MNKLILIALLAAAPAMADSVRREVTTVDPSSGVAVTRIETQADWGTAPVASETITTRVLGAPVVPSVVTVSDGTSISGFPSNPIDEQIAVVNGVTYEYDAEDGEWEREDD
jgi:transcriptional regulator of nitric oxide reductase